MTQKLTLDDVTRAWDVAGERPIHPLDPDSPEFWALGAKQAEQVAEYDRYGNPADCRVIDFGAGNGRLTIPLVQMGYDVTAVDASTQMLTVLGQRAVARLGKDPAGWPGWLTVIHSDGRALAEMFDADGDFGGFDVVISRAVLIHHSYADVEKLVGELVRCLKPGGHLIADWPIGAEPHERANWTDITVWDESERAAVAARAGLTPVDLWSCLGTPGAPVWRKVMEPGELMQGVLDRE